MDDTCQVIAPPEDTSIRGAIPKRSRMGARGQRKVKSGCQTCKIRHKKCDERKPACTPCRTLGHRCDFSEAPQLNAVASYPHALPGINTQAFGLQLMRPPSRLPNHMLFLTDFENMHFDYFRRVCVRDFSLVFESSLWESTLIEAAYTERSIYHAALGISVLSRSNYSPVQDWYDPEFTGSAVEYTMVQYNRAIKCLNARLRIGVERVEIAILGSILFINIEAFQGFQTQMHVHLHGGLELLKSLKKISPSTEYLKSALYQIRDQVEEFEGKEADKNG